MGSLSAGALEPAPPPIKCKVIIKVKVEGMGDNFGESVEAGVAPHRDIPENLVRLYRTSSDCSSIACVLSRSRRPMRLRAVAVNAQSQD